MKRIRKYLLFTLFFTLVLIIFVKSLANIVKVVQEITNPPREKKVEVCPARNENYFKTMTNGSYLYALYRYKALGTKCKK